MDDEVCFGKGQRIDGARASVQGQGRPRAQADGHRSLVDLDVLHRTVRAGEVEAIGNGTPADELHVVGRLTETGEALGARTPGIGVKNRKSIAALLGDRNQTLAVA